jgi:hypothetical protein
VNPSIALLDRLDRLRERVARRVTAQRADDPTADDPLRGLYLTPDAVGHLLSRAIEPSDFGDTAGAEEPDPGDEDRLHRLAVRLGLTPLDTQLLLISLAPDLERTFEPLYGYLNDDVSRRRATIGLALELCGFPVHSAEARARLHPTAPLRALGLLRVEEPERPFLSRSLRVPDRVVGHLLGDDTQDPVLEGRTRPPVALLDQLPLDTLTERLAKRLTAGPLTAYLREHREGDGFACAAAALHAAGLEAVHYTPGDSSPNAGRGDFVDDEIRAVLREARLRDCALLVSPLPKNPGPLVRGLTVADVSVLFAGTAAYDPQWGDGHRDPLVLDAPRQGSRGVGAWSTALSGPAKELDTGLVDVVAPYRLAGEQIYRAARAAQELAALEDSPLSGAHLRRAARQQSASGLEQHARRIQPYVGWGDLVLPQESLTHLRELALRARHRERVLGDWRLAAGGGRGRGVLALFAGESGTGKTLSAEVVAAELGLDLYVVQLSSVVDKYVGETEKNLERIFTEADRTDAVLLFDEADAVFGKRSEVKDSHDRYANLESAYLLQRLESFDGVAVLTTNLRSNIDDAFTRRLDLVVDFPFPDAAQRLALWRHSLLSVPCVPGIDLERCAREFELAGGAIRSAVVTAAYAGAGRGEAVTEADLLAGAQREYRKAGRLVLDENNAW